MQLSFAQWLLSQNDAWISRVQDRLQDEADEQGGGFDYEDLDHSLDQHEQDKEYIKLDWAC